MSNLAYKYGHYWLNIPFLHYPLAERAGFIWNRDRKLWVTPDPEIANTFRQFADKNTLHILDKARDDLENALAQSRATTADIEVPAPQGLTYRAYQLAAIQYAMSRDRVLMGDEMGLGKTIVVCGLLNLMSIIAAVLIICPAGLKINWHRELTKWLVHDCRIAIVNAGDPWPNADVIIINYDILHRYHHQVHRPCWNLLVADECHFLKNHNTRRTKEVMGCRHEGTNPIHAAGILFLSGTPLENRPIEGWSILHFLAPKTFPSFWSYAKRYCAAYKDQYGRWNMTGNSHMDEWRKKVRASIMIRRLKKDVLTELPPKSRQLIELTASGIGRLVQEELTAWQAEVGIDPQTNADAFYNAVRSLLETKRIPFNDIARIRRETGEAKAPAAAKFIVNALESSAKIIAFAHHHSVMRLMGKYFAHKNIGHVTITGRTPLNARQSAVDRFQSDPATNVFLGNIQAAGAGLNLTASSHIIFAEMDWTPGKMIQAEDRAHRMGQIEPVLIQYLTVNGSVDVRLAQAFIHKMEVLDQALDP